MGVFIVRLRRVHEKGFQPTSVGSNVREQDAHARTLLPVRRLTVTKCIRSGTYTHGIHIEPTRVAGLVDNGAQRGGRRAYYTPPRPPQYHVRPRQMHVSTGTATHLHRSLG